MLVNRAKFDVCMSSIFAGVEAYVRTHVQTELRFIQGGPKVGIQLLKVGFGSKSRFVVLM